MPSAVPPTGAVRLGLVGAGGAARLHAEAALGLPGEARVSAVHDLADDRARSLADLTGAKVTRGFTQMLDEGLVDALVVCTPHALHAEPALAAARAGVPVLLEKPMATTLSDCDEVSTAFAEAGVALFLGHIQHYLPLTAAAHRAVREGLIGAPVSVVDRRATDYRPGHRPAWFFDPALAGGGAVMNIGAHCIDRVTWITDARPLYVDARIVGRGGTVETEGLLHLALAGGIRATVSVTAGALSDLDEFEITGELGTLRASKAEGLWLADGSGTPRELRAPSDTNDDVALAFSEQLRDFTAAVRGERPPAVTARTGRDVVATVLAAYASAAGGTVQKVSEPEAPAAG
ncbi:Gfo/Idh/MocA family protein [Streptomyces sp. NPDC051561]|uniref:Gfo/Idh/MocA family protein n=1 Tax=Streptomyces sp. NPDC051561 TaxID=3365658 RepID=UPI00378A80E5